MEEKEASPDSYHHTEDLPGVWKDSPPLWREIYELLLNHPPRKALAIAQPLGRKTARDVNPELYSMKDCRLLDCSEDNLWSLHPPTCAAECRTHMKPSSRTESGTTSNLTEQQKKILDLLHTNKPMRGLDVARGVGKTTTKEVNPDLYSMETMGLLSKQDNLWTARSQGSTGSEENAECRTLRGDTIHSGGRCAAINSDKTGSDERSCNGTQDGYTGTNQELVTKTSATTIINNYYIRDSQNIQIGNENVLISVAESNSESHKLQTTSQHCDSGIGEVSTQHNTSTNQMEAQSLPETDLSNAEEFLLTLSPSSSHHHAQDWDLLDICGSLQLVSLDNGDCHNASTQDASTYIVSTHDGSSHEASSHSVSIHDASSHIVNTQDANRHSVSSHSVSTHDTSSHDVSSHDVSSHDVSGEDEADAGS